MQCLIITDALIVEDTWGRGERSFEESGQVILPISQMDHTAALQNADKVPARARARV